MLFTCEAKDTEFISQGLPRAIPDAGQNTPILTWQISARLARLGLWATRMLKSCCMCAIVSEVLIMHGIVAVSMVLVVGLLPFCLVFFFAFDEICSKVVLLLILQMLVKFNELPPPPSFLLPSFPSSPLGTVMETLDCVSGLHNGLEYSQLPLVFILDQAVETRKTSSIA